MRTTRALPAPAGRARRRLTPRRSVLVASLVVGLTASALAVPSAGADQISDKRAQAQQVATKLDELEAKVNHLDDETEKAKGELAAAEQALADAQQRADQANAEMQVRETQLQSFAVDAYVNGNSAPGVDALFASDSNDAPKVKGYLEVTTGNRQDLVDQLQATKQKAEQEGEKLASARADLAARNDSIQAQLADAQDAADQQAAIKSKLDGEVATLVAEQQAAKAAEAQRQAEARAAQQLAEAPRSTTTTPSGTAAATPKATVPAPAPAVPSGPPPTLRAGVAGAVDAAMSKIGSPYVWAASGPDTFDCSGLVMWAFGQVGIGLPHYSGAQYAVTRRISAGEAQAGDLVFFWGPGESGDPGHVGIYIGGGSFVHAPGRGKFVRVDSVGYWSGARVAYGRI